MLQTIPLKATPKQTINCVLNGQNCTIYIFYSGGKTYMTFAVDGEVIEAGMICQNSNILPRSNHPNFKGWLFFLDLIAKRDPIYTAFEDSIYLYYAENSEDLEEFINE